MTTGLGLFSGGLDSILASRLLMEQGIRVRVLRFVTPFFGFELLADPETYREKVRHTYGIEVCLYDLSLPYLAMLADPPHGYGKNFNPCIDCKILLLREAKRLMPEFSASFLFTGEVLGQRPMSQRRDTLRLIERESGCDGILLRPLCAKSQLPTQVEEEGLVDRQGLLNFQGRSRQPQRQLAARFGISDYPTPAGGCLLTDVSMAARVAWYYGRPEKPTVAGVRILLAGRQFRLPAGGLLSLGRDERENEKIEALYRSSGEGLLLIMNDRPGPAAVLRGSDSADDLAAAAGLVVRFGKKLDGRPAAGTVLVEEAGKRWPLTVEPLADSLFADWYL